MDHILQLSCGQQEFAAAQGQHVILFHILENTVDGTKGAAGFGSQELAVQFEAADPVYWGDLAGFLADNFM